LANATLPAADDAAWAGAEWMPFATPINARNATPPTRAAILYNNANLYVSVVAQRTAVVSEVMTDTLSLFLDTQGDGREVIEIAIDLNAASAGDGTAKSSPVFTWFRAPAPARPSEHGAPDAVLPIDRFPNIRVQGVSCVVRDGIENLLPIRSAVIGIPLRSLPAPFQAVMPGGAPYKLNIVRALSIANDGKHPAELQSSLSPVPAGIQSYPQRMAELQFSK
jgi:hypothetical protein